MDGPARLTEAWEGFFRTWINRMNNHWVFWIDESFWGGENVLQKEALCGELLEVGWLLSSVSCNYRSIFSCARNKWLRGLNREKVMPTLFFFFKEETSSLCYYSPDFFFFPPKSSQGEAIQWRRLTFWQYLRWVSSRTWWDVPRLLAALSPRGQKKKKGNIVTGNTKCSLRNRSLSTVEKLFDLLTHFIGIGKTT